MRGRLLSVNLAVPRTFESRGRVVPTGIFKEPAAGRVQLRELSLEGDVQADRRYHGGAEKAVYLYPSEHYPHWKGFLGRDLSAGFFGENFTTEGLYEDTVHLGDTFRVGTALVQVTRPRSPCFKLGLKVGSARFIKSFLESRRLGFYLRVLQEGAVGAGDPIERITVDPARITVADDIERLYFGGPGGRADHGT
ncbi:MAG TPA: MOSC domain-containing protein [Thermoanaerobaculia bacterium]|nr:MOSC domain-containing protein [Thermoanaerobaculia bacterium]